MKKLYMRTIVGFSGRDCVLIILFQLYGSKTRLSEGNLFWVGQYGTPSCNLHTGRRTNLILNNLIQLLSNLSKIIPSWKAADIIL